jgi:acetylglutamate kinase
MFELMENIEPKIKKKIGINMIKEIEKPKILIEALQYIKKFSGKTVVIKFGGSIMENPTIKDSLIEDVVLMKLVGINVILIHGGGTAINKMLSKLGIKTKFYNGLRITDEKTMEIVEMVLSGKINKGIVNNIQSHGFDAIGICGKDGNLLEAKKKIVKDNDLGFVGEITSVNSRFLTRIIENSLIPVIAPIGKDSLGNSYNINADDVALAIAKALNVEKLIFLTDTVGVLRDINDDTSLISIISIEQALSFIKDGIIKDGMIPKVECCVDAIKSGVNKVHIIDGRIEHSLLLELFTPEGIGTMFEK